MGAHIITNAERILASIDAHLSVPVELTLFGRAALLLGFNKPKPEYALSLDVDAVLVTGQAEALNATTDFWPAIDAVNRDLAESGLYVSHFFAEEQVILRPDWYHHRVPIRGPWVHLTLFRLGNEDLLLSKLMRDDPIDQEDARFIIDCAGLTKMTIEGLLQQARVPDSVEIREQFASASHRLLHTLR